MKTAVIYARYSSERQTEQSIEGQLRVCNEYAERNDIVIVDTYIDRAMTGKNDKRTAFQKMLKDSFKKNWNYVIVYRTDRFGRNKYEIAINKHTLKINGIKLLSAMENIPDTPEGIILESLLEGMAEYYSAELAQKVTRGMNESRLKGQFTGGKVLYGYKVENKKVLIDEETSGIVKYIYEQYINDVIVDDIIKDLTAKGITKDGKPFKRSTVYDMLANEKYIGILRHKDEVFTNIYPRIISDDVYQIVKSKIEKNRHGRKDVKSKYLLSRKMHCGYCGAVMYGESGTSKDKVTRRYYKCGSKKNGSKMCIKSQLKKEEIEELLVDTTLKTFNKENLNFIADELTKGSRIETEEQAVLTALEKEQTEIEKSINNLVSAMEQGIILESTKSRLEELEKQRNEIKTKITIIKNNKKLQYTKDDILAFIKNALSKSPKVMLDLLIKNIVVYNDKIEVVYNFIADMYNPDGNDRRAFCFLEKNCQLTEVSNNYKKSTKTMTLRLYF